MTQRALACLTLAALVLAGCGANPAANKRPKTRRPAMAQMQAPGMAMPATGQHPPEVMQMLDGLRRAQAGVPGFTATIETYDKGPKGQDQSVMKVAYKKPSTLKIEMVKAQGQAQGAKILWTGGSSLKIKPSFLPMSVEKGVSDEAVVSKNGWTIRETEVNAIFKVVFDPAAQIRPVGQQAIAGMNLSMFEVKSPASPRGATHEVIGMNPQTGLPGVRMLFKGQELIYRLTIKNLAVKAVSQAELDV